MPSANSQPAATRPVLVTGATGQIGSLVVRGLVAAGTPVRALVRDAARATQLAALGVELAVGDLARPSSVAAALAGVEQAFLLSPSQPDQVELPTAFVAEARRAGIAQLVKLSGAHADVAAATRFARWHGEVEQIIRQSGIAYTFVQPVYFMQNLPAQIRSAGGRFLTPVAPDLAVSLVDVRDIAAVAVVALTQSGHTGQTYLVTGPRLVSHREMAATITAATGRELHYEQVPVGAFIQALLRAGQPEWLTQGVSELFLHMDTDVTRVVRDVVDREPIDFREYVGEHVAEFDAAREA